MGHSKGIVCILGALTIGFVFCGQGSAFFEVGGKPFMDTWMDDFDDGVIDTAKWPVTTNITESAVPPGTLSHTTVYKRDTTSANFSAEFAGATEWAYWFRVQVPTSMGPVSNRASYVFQTPDITVHAFNPWDTYWELWVGGEEGYYTNYITPPYKSGMLNFDQFYEVALHRKDGANLYDVYLDGAKVASDIASKGYTAGEVPGTIHFGQPSSSGNFPGIYDYMYAGIPPIPGDANLDDLVDTQDFTILKAHFGQDPAVWTEGNFNEDTLVDTQDFTILKAHFGESRGAGAAAAPEPATIALLALGGLVPLLRRRRA